MKKELQKARDAKTLAQWAYLLDASYFPHARGLVPGLCVAKGDDCCGGCEHFKYEMLDGYGVCELHEKGNLYTYCNGVCKDFKAGKNKADEEIDKRIEEFFKEYDE